MKLTIKEALQKGMKAHKEGKQEEADQYYTAILNAQKNHPDANHNRGIIAVSLDNIEEALPYFKRAIDTNPKIEHFWFSYIEALIKLKRIKDAKAVLKQAKDNIINKDLLNKLERMHLGMSTTENLKSKKSLFTNAVELRESGKFNQAIDLLKDEITQFPQDPNLQALLSHCYFLNGNIQEASIQLEKAKILDPDNAMVGWNTVRLLLKSKKVAEALVIARSTYARFPDDVEGMAVLGTCLRSSNDLEESMIYLNKAIEINPNYAEALINRGLIQLAKENEVFALEDLEKAHKIKPYLKQIWDLVIGLKFKLEQYSEAILLIIKMIEIDPNHEKSFTSLAACNQKANDILLAIKSFKKVLEFKPDDVKNIMNLGIAYYKQGDLKASISTFKRALIIKPDYAEAFKNMGVTLEGQGKLEEALEVYNKALTIKPDYAEVYNGMGVTLKTQGKLEESIKAYNKALTIKPGYAEAYNNMGVTLNTQGKLEESIKAYNKALTIKPGYAEAYYNMGISLKGQGKLEESIKAHNKAITIKPDYAEAYNNMGLDLLEYGKIDEAIKALTKALSIKPNYAAAAWNLSGTSENICESKKWINLCLESDSSHLEAKLTLSALQYYEGDKSGFNDLINSALKGHSYLRSFLWAFDLPKLPELYFHKCALFDRMIAMSKKDRPFYEFGVFRGLSFQYLIKTFKKGYGFDTFQGIPEDWYEEKAGTYSSDGQIPKIEGGEFVVGRFEDTLPSFFSEPKAMASIINFDADLYSSTICALNFSKPVIDKHTILIFDEFIINKYWEQDEYKALNEFCLKNNYTYEVLAISFFTKQVAVRLLGKL